MNAPSVVVLSTLIGIAALSLAMSLNGLAVLSFAMSVIIALGAFRS